LVPYFRGAEALPAEDAMELSSRARPGARLRVVALCLPMIANFDDLDPLAEEPGVDLRLIRPGEAIPDCDVVVLPGSKSTLSDLASLRASGWDVDLAAHVRRGGRVLGICGGYQMLGRVVADPDGIEGPPGAAVGLGLLDVETVLSGRKTLEEMPGLLAREWDEQMARFLQHIREHPDGPLRAVQDFPYREEILGYEMHMGITSGPDRGRPFAMVQNGIGEGSVSADGRVIGTYLHGLLANDSTRAALLQEWGAAPSHHRHEAIIEATLDALAAHLEAHIDLDRLFSLAR